jgi:RNA polymerase sigma-70 factor (ECF subfamily)
VDDHPLVDPGDDPSLQAEQKERVTQVIAALQQLGERCQQLFRLKLEGHTFPEIMNIFGERSINTIYTWDSRCRKQLLALMGGRWGTNPFEGNAQKTNTETVG